MTTLTNNQKEALTVLNKEILEKGDLLPEQIGEGRDPNSMGDWVIVSELITALVNSGWDQKQAEGTIGSLIGTYMWEDDEDVFGNPNVHLITGEQIYWLKFYQQEVA